MKKVLVCLLLMAVLMASMAAPAQALGDQRHTRRDITKKALWSRLNAREQYAKKGLAIYSNKGIEAELEANLRHVQKFSVISKAVYTWAIFLLANRGSKYFHSEQARDPYLTLAEMGIAAPLCWTLEIVAEVAFYFARDIKKVDIKGTGFKEFDELHRLVRAKKTELENQAGGGLSDFINIVYLGTNAVSLHWAYLAEHEMHKKLFQEELRYIADQKALLLSPKKGDAARGDRTEIHFDREEVQNQLDTLFDLEKLIALSENVT